MRRYRTVEERRLSASLDAAHNRLQSEAATMSATEMLKLIAQLNRLEYRLEKLGNTVEDRQAAKRSQRPAIPTAADADAADLLKELDRLAGEDRAKVPAQDAPPEAGNAVSSPPQPPASPEVPPEAPKRVCKVVVCTVEATQELGEHGWFCPKHHAEGVTRGMDKPRPAEPTPQVNAVSWDSIHRQPGSQFDQIGWQNSQEIWRDQVRAEADQKASEARQAQQDRAREAGDTRAWESWRRA
jgi:hypothetical protein